MGAGRRAHCCKHDVASSELTLGWHSSRLLCAASSSISLSSLESISSSCGGKSTARGVQNVVRPSSGRVTAHDFVEELLLALVEVGAQFDEFVWPQIDDAVVNLLVVVLAALLGHLWSSKGAGS